MTTQYQKTEFPVCKFITTEAIAKSSQLAELKVCYRRPSQANEPLTQAALIDTPERAIAYVRHLWDEDTIELKEEFFLICLSKSLHVNGWIRLYSGGLDSCTADTRLVLAIALQTASCAIIVAHNHPSGGVKPSAEDRKFTRRLAESCSLLSIQLLDHVIISLESAYSFHEYEPETCQ